MLAFETQNNPQLDHKQILLDQMGVLHLGDTSDYPQPRVQG